MSKRKKIYRYYYNNTGMVEYKYIMQEKDDRILPNVDLPYVESDQDININEKKYDATNKRWIVNQNPAPKISDIRQR